MLVVSGEFAKTIETGTCPTAELVFVIVPLGGGAGRGGRSVTRRWRLARSPAQRAPAPPRAPFPALPPPCERAVT